MKVEHALLECISTRVLTANEGTGVRGSFNNLRVLCPIWRLGRKPSWSPVEGAAAATTRVNKLGGSKVDQPRRQGGKGNQVESRRQRGRVSLETLRIKHQRLTLRGSPRPNFRVSETSEWFRSPDVQQAPTARKRDRQRKYH